MRCSHPHLEFSTFHPTPATMSGSSQSMKRKKHAYSSSKRSRAQNQMVKRKQLQQNALLQHAFRLSSESSLKSSLTITQDNVYLRELLLLAKRTRANISYGEGLASEQATHQLSLPSLKASPEKLVNVQSSETNKKFNGNDEETLDRSRNNKKEDLEEKEKTVRFRPTPTAFIGENCVETTEEKKNGRCSNESQDICSSRQSRSRSRLSPRTRRCPTPFVRRTASTSLTNEEEERKDAETQTERGSSLSNLRSRKTTSVITHESNDSCTNPRSEFNYSDGAHKSPLIDDQFVAFELQNIKGPLTRCSNLKNLNPEKELKKETKFLFDTAPAKENSDGTIDI